MLYMYYIHMYIYYWIIYIYIRINFNFDTVDLECVIDDTSSNDFKDRGWRTKWLKHKSGGTVIPPWNLGRYRCTPHLQKWTPRNRTVVERGEEYRKKKDKHTVAKWKSKKRKREGEREREREILKSGKGVAPPLSSDYEGATRWAPREWGRWN